MRCSSPLKLDPESVTRQTRVFASLARIARIVAVLIFVISMIYGTASLVAMDRWPSLTDEDALFPPSAVMVMISGVFQAAVCLVLASILDSLRIMAVNAARAAAAVA